MNLISRKEAMLKGLARYFTGKGCWQGHMAERLVSNRCCLQCHALKEELRRFRNIEKARLRDKKSRVLNDQSSRHLKINHTPEQWKIKLNYHKVKSHERRNYSYGSLSKDIWQKLFKLQNGICNGCHSKLKDNAHIDHILPLSRGGENIDGNVQLLCPYCNLSKGSKTMKEWKGI